jgi:hypothetical protein
MFKIALCKFSNDTHKTYEYRIPSYIDHTTIVEGMRAIVSSKTAVERVNPTNVIIVEVKDALDGEWDQDYAWLLGVVDITPFEEMLAREHRRKRLMTLIKNEKKRLVEEMDLDDLAGKSPEIAKLVEELRSLR